jgi:hypothetical protein
LDSLDFKRLFNQYCDHLPTPGVIIMAVVTTITLPEELRDRLEAHRIRTGASINKTIGLALDHYLYSLERDAAILRQLQQPLPGDPVNLAARQVVKELNGGTLPDDGRQ